MVASRLTRRTIAVVIPVFALLLGVSQLSAHVAGDAGATVDLVASQVASEEDANVAALALDGTRAYIAAGPRLLILDISNPADPRLLGQSRVAPTAISSLVVGWPYVFVASVGILAVTDISDVAHPRFVNSYTYESDGSTPQLKVDHHTGYLLDNSGLRVLELSRPVLPREIGFLAIPGGRTDPDAFSLLEEALYVGGSDGNTWIVDARDPANPVIAGQIAELGTNLLINEPFGSA
jgi:hypothetical protein